MGDENTLAGTTKAHKHTAPASDGGFLQTTDTGVTNMSEGSIGYYDSSSVLQELTISSASDQLRVNAGATALEYFTPSGGGATLTRSTASSTVAQTTSSLTAVSATGFSAVLQAGAGMAICWFGTSIEGSNDAFQQWDFDVDGTQPHLAYRTHSGRVPAQITGMSSTLSAQTAQLEFGMLSAGSVTIQKDSNQGSMVIVEIS